jgi:sugar lactone lactonase YvrE
MQFNDFRRPSMLGRMVATALLVVIAGLVGAAHAALPLTFQSLGGGFTGDGGQAKQANLNGVTDVVFDSAGNLYVSQTQANRIRKITPNGVISTIAGGNNGFGGDNGPAANALIDQPWGMAIDASDNLFFVDYGNRRVRRIAPNGTITTVAGNGLRVDAGDGGTALKASFRDLADLTIDKNGNMFVSEPNGNRVRKITAAGAISTYAGVGEPFFQGDGGPATAAYLDTPWGITVDGAGNLYIADTGNARIRRVAANGIITTFVGDGSSIAYNVNADKSGNVYVSMDCRLVKYNSAGVAQVTYDGYPLVCQRAPEGTLATSAGFGFVDGVALDANGNVFFVDSDYQRVAKVTIADNKLWTHAGVSPQFPDGTSAASAPLMSMNHVAVADNGTVVVYDQRAWRVRTIVGGKVSALAGNGSTLGSFQGAPCEANCGSALNWSFPSIGGLATGPGNVVYVADRASGVHRIGLDKTAQIVVPLGRDGARPYGVATDLAGNLYIADYDYHRIRKLDTAGVLTTIAGTGQPYDPVGDGGPALSAGIYHPSVVALDGGGAVYLHDAQTLAIRKVGRDGKIRRVAGNGAGGEYAGEGGLALNATLGGVVGRIAVHPTGVYFTSGGKIRRVRPDARIETLAFPQYVSGLAIKYGYLYVTTANGTVQRALLPRAVANADYNGDGKSDVLFRGTAGANLVWLSANSTTKQVVATLATEQKLAGQGDFDGDGKVDLAWRNTLTGANTIWRSANANTQMILTAVADQNWTIAGVGDFNGDGKADLFWRNKVTGSNEYWPGGNASAKKAVSAQLDMKLVLAGVGDFDGDGRSDLLWRHVQTGVNVIWPGALSSQVQKIGAVNVAWKAAAIGDFNGDGTDDVVWRDPATGGSAIWRSANSAWRQSIVSVLNPQWSIAATGDYDNDGFDDLLWRNNVTGENVIWKAASNAKQLAVASAGASWKVQPVNAQP